jgi:exosortase K
MIWGAQLLLVLLCAFALKWFYSTATPDDLRWIIAPTTVLVELLSGKSFEFESYAGYMSSDRSFLIATSCAGVNFLLTAFAMLALRHLWKHRFQATGWSFIPLAALCAFAVTLIANTVRIWIALQHLQSDWLTRNQLHRVEGIVVYFGFLLALFLLTNKSREPQRSPAFVLPLLIYYASTLGIPLANGAWQKGTAFWEYFGFVLLLPLVLTAMVVVARKLFTGLQDFSDLQES